MDVADRLKTWREAFGISQYRLSKDSGVAASAINKIESNNMKPTVELMEKLCNAMNISLAKFFSDEPFDGDRISRLTPEQRKALEAFLDALDGR